MGHPRTMGFAIPDGKLVVTALYRVSKWKKKNSYLGELFL